LLPCAALFGVNRWPHQDKATQAVWLVDGQLGGDLTSHRVCNECRPLESERVKTAAKGVREVANVEGRGRPIAATISGQIRHVDGESA
jgi:hypothetical protein